MSPDRLAMTIALGSWLLSLVYVLASCTPAATANAVDDAAYEKDLASCREAAKKRPDACAFYLDCRKGVAARYGRKFSGVCTDGDK